MHAKLATTADVASWLEIVREVEPLFGPMPDFETTLLRKINQRAALCVRSGDPVIVLGGVLLGGGVPYGWIRWLAVRSSARGIGIGQCLVEEAVKRLATSNAISVDTFREENTEGRPARRLYERLGFLPGPLVQIEGLPRQRYTLSRLHKSDFCNG
jgi:ribosomal protein S18 acetylase RimI-like enzyme